MSTIAIILTAMTLNAGQVADQLDPQPASSGDETRIGLKATAGGRYDNVRMCVATAAGTKGGPAMDVSVFFEIPLGHDTLVAISLPVMRPILFAAAFGMLQFESDITLKLRTNTPWDADLIYGPSLGLSLHHGPDYTSGLGDERGPDFFAWGPRLGAYLGVDLSRATGFNLQVGLAPAVSPLFAAGGPGQRDGWVANFMLDVQLGLLEL